MKKTVYNKLIKKGNNLENKIPDLTVLIHIIQYNTNKTKFGQKDWRC